MNAPKKKAAGLGTQTAFRNHRYDREYTTAGDLIEQNIAGQQAAEDFLKSLDTAGPEDLFKLATDSPSLSYLMGLCRRVQKQLERRCT